MSPDPLSSSAMWVHELLFVSLLPIIASLAIAFIGFRMLFGRLGPGRGMTIVIGIFLALGAPAIATGLLSGMQTPPGGLHPSDFQMSVAEEPPQIEQEPARSPYSRSSVGN